MDEATLYNLHAKYAPNNELLELVWSHSLIVANIAEQIIDSHPGLEIDRDLLITGCLLHDIGVYLVEPCKCHPRERKANEEPYIKHGIVGADIVRQEGFPEPVAKIVERHIGVGISKKQIIAQRLPLPHKDFIPKTLEEKLVAYCDNFHSKKPKFNTYEEIEKKLAEYGQENIRWLEELRGMFGIPNVQKIRSTKSEIRNKFQ